MATAAERAEKYKKVLYIALIIILEVFFFVHFLLREQCLGIRAIRD